MVSESSPEPGFVVDDAELARLFDQVFQRQGTLRDFFVELGAASQRLIPGHIFREGLEAFELRPYFQALLPDQSIWENLDGVWCDRSPSGGLVEFRFSSPQTYKQATPIGSVDLKLNRAIRFDVDPQGDVRLRPGEIQVRWFLKSEDVHIRLHQQKAAGSHPARDVLLLSAGNVFKRKITLNPFPTPAADLPAAPPTAESVAARPEPAGRPAHIIHQLRGRVRFKIETLYHNPPLKHRLEENLRRLPGIRRVSANSLTGRLLVRFDQDIDFDRLLTVVEGLVLKPDFSADWLVQQAPAPWHALTPAEVLAFWSSSGDDGLSPEAARERQLEHGPNRLPLISSRSRWEIFREQLKSPPVILLGVSAFLSILTGGVADGVVILGVVLLNAGIGYATENWAEETIAGLTRGITPTALVRRNGREIAVSADDLVPGDLIILKRSMMVPADARLLTTRDLTVDESTLTGESMPVAKRPETIDTTNVPLANRANMVYRGTIVTGGSATAVVIATGPMTEVGQIQHLLASAQSPETPLQGQLRILGGQLAIGSIAVCGIVFVIGVVRGQGVLQMLKIAVSLAVAAVPEGLPTVATSTLALGVQRLRDQQIFVRKLSAVETLGALQYVCLDKTGTITLNRMSLVATYAGHRHFERRAGQFLFDEEQVNARHTSDLAAVLRLATLCSEVEIEQLPAGKPRLNGSPTETALVQAAVDAGLDPTELRERFPLISTRLRSDDRPFMDTLHATSTGELLLAVKGSPAVVLNLCSQQLVEGEIIPLTNEERVQIRMENERMAGRALRVLGLAYGNEQPAPGQQLDLVWAGLVGIADPPREEISTLIATLRQAGIHTTMITGDQSATASAIAREIGLGRNSHLQTLDSTRLEELEPDVLRSLAQQVDVFSRVSPAHKLQIVQALQRAGQVVAMTGDGVNDGPALRAADIGIAMGQEGSEVAQEVADLVIHDNDLASLIMAVEQGRTIYEDIRKAIHFILSSNTSEILTMGITVSAGLGGTLNPIQLLWINLVTDVFPEIALGLEPPEADVMARLPRAPETPMFSPAELRRFALEGSMITAGTLTALAYGLSRYGAGPRASTMAFTSITAAQLFHAITCRSQPHSVFDSTPYPKNPYLTLAVGGGLALQVAATLVPGLQQILGITRLSLLDWLVTGSTAIVPFVINEVRKTLPPLHPDSDEEEVNGSLPLGNERLTEED